MSDGSQRFIQLYQEKIKWCFLNKSFNKSILSVHSVILKGVNIIFSSFDC